MGEKKGGVMDFLYQLNSKSYQYYGMICVILLIGELFLSLAIVRFIPYTEIDWRAYMDEVAGPIERNDYNYENLKGDTGPLVYPAGFVYIYGILYFLTDSGNDILLGQYIFVGIYVLFIAILMDIYRQAKVPPAVLILLCISRRCHSIFVLRLFNDCIAMLLAYGAISLFSRRKWIIGCVLYSLGVSVKMNVLLFAPALLFLLISEYGLFYSLFPLSICAAIQLFLSLPFIQVNLVGYLVRSFNLGRVFIHYWTVNLKFLPEEIFVSKGVAIGLLIIQISLLGYFLFYKWGLPPYSSKSPKSSKSSSKPSSKPSTFSSLSSPSPRFIIEMLFSSNLIGIICARSLHYQFYSWYYHQLPLILFACSDILSPFLSISLILVIEVIWNIFPSNFYSSLCLQGCHLVILLAMILSKKLFSSRG